MNRTWIGLCVAAGVALSAGAWFAHRHWQQGRPLMPLAFPHEPHASVNCITCHHDYKDQSPSVSGNRTCILCHKQSPALAVRIEADFHQLCQSCHLERLQAFHASGPVRSCQACHRDSTEKSKP